MTTPDPCRLCRHLYGRSPAAGSPVLVCGMHAYGPNGDSCEDFEKLGVDAPRTSRMLPWQGVEAEEVVGVLRQSPERPEWLQEFADPDGTWRQLQLGEGTPLPQRPWLGTVEGAEEFRADWERSHPVSAGYVGYVVPPNQSKPLWRRFGAWLRSPYSWGEARGRAHAEKFARWLGWLK